MALRTGTCLNYIYKCDALKFLSSLRAASVDFVYTDPPYNTGKKQKNVTTGMSYVDAYGSYYKNFIYPIFEQLARVSKNDAVVCVHLDWRESHKAKVWLDEIFGENAFLAEIIVHSELGGVRKNFWTIKHSTILIYCRGTPVFNTEDIPTLKRSQSDLTKRLDSVWNYTLSNSASERVGYPNQKPIAIVRNLVLAHTNKGDVVLDPFAGSGTTGYVSKINGRKSLMCDTNPESINVCVEKRGQIERKLPNGK